MAAEPLRATRREDPPPPLPGYEILDFIGRGSSGAVYRARQLAVDREVAIKILHPHLARESRSVRRLQREARTTARLAHPHIVSAVDMGEADGRWWYAMEFVDGPSLGQRLRAEGRLREREALRLFIPLCEALEHLWEHGVVHRDIKPANILIDKTGGARLADLGLAVAEDDPSITGTGGTLGTPHYISPEQAVDPRKADVRSDIWSFGATLYHAVCGRPPFSGDSAAEVLSGVLYSRIPDPLDLETGLSSRLALVLRKCLTRDPARRYQNPHELLLDLERVRERRAPKIRRGLLDPVQRRADQARRLALGATAGLVVVLAALFLVLPRWLAHEPVPGIAEPSDAGPFEPLSELAERRARGLGKPAELLGDLLALEPRLPLRERVRYEELLREIDADLRRSVRGLRTEIEGEVDAAIHEGDLAHGWQVATEQLEGRFVAGTGYGLSGLASVGVELGPWRERLTLNLQAATETALSELEALLLDWRGARLSEVETSLDHQDWQRAFAALSPPDTETLLAQAGFGIHLPQASQEGLLYDLMAQFRRRSERLRDEWLALDRELRNFVVTRRGTLERQLRESRPRIDAESMLRADFERELFDRRLTRDKMPEGLSRAGLEELEKSARDLATLEDSLLEEDARDDYAEVEELTLEALRKRDYARGLALWEDLHERLVGAPRFDGSAARGELVRRCEVRIAEARALDGLLERVSEQLRALDGRSVELRWGSIVYPSVRLRAGLDPRREGFHADSIVGTLRIQELPSQQLETFAALGAEAELEPEDRLTLACFRLRDTRPRDAQRAFFSGPLPTAEPLRALGADLAARIAEALERDDRRQGARELEAKRLLDDVFDPAFQRHSPRVAHARVVRLLDQFGNVALVKQQRAELLRLRASLEASEPEDAEREFQRAFDPDRLDLGVLGRVRLEYDFGEGRLGGWDGGGFEFDGLGLTLGPRSSIVGWDQLAAESGMRLGLKSPFVADTFELRLRFEALQGENPGRLLWIDAGGFQLVLCGADLPGLGGGPRFLLAVEDGNALLQRILAGEGKPVEGLSVPGAPPRELTFKGYRRSGRCEVTLDGQPLEASAGLRAPPSEARSIQIRSWGAVRLLGATLEGGR